MDSPIPWFKPNPFIKSRFVLLTSNRISVRVGAACSYIGPGGVVRCVHDSCNTDIVTLELSVLSSSTGERLAGLFGLALLSGAECLRV